MSSSFDISAKAENPGATPGEMNEMLKSRLMDRFQLRAHTETREATTSGSEARQERRDARPKAETLVTFMSHGS